MLPSPILSVMDDIEELSLESASTFGTLGSMKVGICSSALPKLLCSQHANKTLTYCKNELIIKTS